MVGQVRHVNLRLQSLPVRPHIGEVITDGRVEQGIGRNDEGVEVVAVGFADIANAGAEPKSSKRAVVPGVLAPDGALILSRAHHVFAGIACNARGHARIEMAVARDDLQLAGEVALEFELKAAHPHRIRLHVEEEIGRIASQHILLTDVEHRRRDHEVRSVGLELDADFGALTRRGPERLAGAVGAEVRRERRRVADIGRQADVEQIVDSLSGKFRPAPMA